MVSALDSGVSGPGSSPGRGHCVVIFTGHFTLPSLRLPCNELASNSGGVEILLGASCYRNRDKLRPDEQLGSYADLTYLHLYKQH